MNLKIIYTNMAESLRKYLNLWRFTRLRTKKVQKLNYLINFFFTKILKKLVKKLIKLIKQNCKIHILNYVKRNNLLQRKISFLLNFYLIVIFLFLKTLKFNAKFLHIGNCCRYMQCSLVYLILVCRHTILPTTWCTITTWNKPTNGSIQVNINIESC